MTRTKPILSVGQVAPPLAATSYAEALDELAAFAASQTGVIDGERFLRQVSALGAEDTMAVGAGAFIRHLRSDAIDRVVTVLGIVERPLRVPAETGGETRGRLLVLVAAPPGGSAGYLETVASLAAVLREDGALEALLSAPDAQSIVDLPVIRNAPRVQKLSVIDVMEPASQRIYPEMPLREAARLMTRGAYTGLPVVNKRDEIVGMISEKDLIRDFLPGYLRVFESPSDPATREESDPAVRDVMSKAVLCLPIEASISEAASIIVNKNVDPLPLTRDGKWVGLISRRSLIRKLLQF